MTIDQAIQILKEIDSVQPTVDLHKWRDAVKLGVEALKYARVLRADVHYRRDTTLPGERE